MSRVLYQAVEKYKPPKTKKTESNYRNEKTRLQCEEEKYHTSLESGGDALMTIEIAEFRCPSCGHTMGEDTTETELLTKICENQDWVIQEQIMQIRELQKSIS